MLRFFSVRVERMVVTQQHVYYSLQTHFLHQFIPLLHRLFFLKICNNENGITEAGET